MTIDQARAAFLHPGDEYAPLPFWFINDELTEAELSRQIRDFHDKGVGGFVFHPRKGLPRSIPYLSDAYMHFVRHAVCEAARLGMHVVLYDEAMYPSGSAHGMVVRENPAFASRCLRMRVCTSPVPASDDLVAVCAARLENGLAREIEALSPQEGVYRAAAGKALLCFALAFSGGTIRGVHEDEDDGEPLAPASADLLNADAVRTFIRLTHARYFEALGEHFGSTIIAMFTDEPDIMGRNAQPGGVAWTTDFMQDFLAQGLSPADLPALFLDAGEGTQDIRRRYRRALNRRMNQTYYGQLAAWCDAHGIALTGHPAKGYDIGLLRHFQLPGQDVVWRFVDPQDGVRGEESVLAKCASDAARHRGCRRNANECFGCCGPNGVQWAFTMDDMKWYMDYLFVRGTNLLYPHAFFYSIRDGRGMERPPDVGPHNFWWPWYAQISMYMRRLSWLMTDSVNQARVAVLCEEDRMPWEICVPLYENQIEFNYLERDLLPACTREGDALCIRAQRYTHIIDGELPGELPRDAVISPAAKALRVSHVIKDGLHFYLLVNEGETEIEGRLLVAARGSAQWWDAWTGSTSPAPLGTDSRYALRLARRQSVILCIDPEGTPIVQSEPPAASAMTTALPLAAQRWQVAPLLGGYAPFVLTADDAGSLPSWAEQPGLSAYSGFMAYETDILTDRPATLDLGTVSGISRLFVDGSQAGMHMWGPHRYALPAGAHSLRIEVCNTPANAYEGRALPSGIMGPVQLASL